MTESGDPKPGSTALHSAVPITVASYSALIQTAIAVFSASGIILAGVFFIIEFSVGRTLELTNSRLDDLRSEYTRETDRINDNVQGIMSEIAAAVSAIKSSESRIATVSDVLHRDTERIDQNVRELGSSLRVLAESQIRLEEGQRRLEQALSGIARPQNFLITDAKDRVIQVGVHGNLYPALGYVGPGRVGRLFLSEEIVMSILENDFSRFAPLFDPLVRETPSAKISKVTDAGASTSFEVRGAFGVCFDPSETLTAEDTVESLLFLDRWNVDVHVASRRALGHLAKGSSMTVVAATRGEVVGNLVTPANYVDSVKVDLLNLFGSRGLRLGSDLDLRPASIGMRVAAAQIPFPSTPLPCYYFKAIDGGDFLLSRINLSAGPAQLVVSAFGRSMQYRRDTDREPFRIGDLIANANQLYQLDIEK